MPLPTVNDVMTPPNPPGLGDALNHSSPITAGSTTNFSAKIGNAGWAGNKLTITGTGLMNYWFIPAVHGAVSYCVVPGRGSGEAYVISDQYGGCEYHELYHAGNNLLAFLHVYRGNGSTTPYNMGPGWALRTIKRSSAISATLGNNWSVSCIDRSTNPPTVQSKFIRVTGYGPINVAGEDNGDTPYG